MASSAVCVCVASRSLIKSEAVMLAMADLGVVNCEHIAVATCSGVADQPIGLDEINDGASNRLAEAVAAKPDANVWVSLENGVVKMFPFTWLELAIVKVKIAETGTVGTASSVGIEVPDALVIDAAKQGTVGKALVERMGGGNHADPHSEITGGRKSRVDLLREAVVTAYGIAERK